MRDFIKENLRIQLENLLYEYHENFDEIPDSIRYPETRVRSKEQLIKLSELAKKLNNQYRDIFGGINDGDGTYTFKITKSGNGFLIVHDNGKDDRDYRLGQEGKALRLNANAFGSQGDKSDKTVFFPIVDAKIKLLADDESIKNIMDFDFEGSYTADDQLEKNKELSTQSVASDEFDKREKLNRATRKNTLSINEPDATESKEYKDAVRIYQNLLPLYKEKSKKGEDIEPLKTRLDDLKAIIDKINPNYGK
jgi:hypothetical protein